MGGLLGPLEIDAATLRARPDRGRRPPPRTRPPWSAGPGTSAPSWRPGRRRCATLVAECVRTRRPGAPVRGARRRALGPVPNTADQLEIYLRRLDQVARAMTVAQDAYAEALARARASWATGSRRTGPRPRPLGVADLPDVARAYADGPAALDRQPEPDGPGRAAGQPVPDLPADSRRPHDRVHPAGLHRHHRRRLLRRLRQPRAGRTRPAAHGRRGRRRRRSASGPAPCTQPGCTGTIVDGYCDVCGSPAGGLRGRR